MRRIAKVLIVAALLPLASLARANDGFYVSITGGVNSLSDLSINDATNTLGPLGTEVEMNPGLTVTGAIGHHWRFPERIADVRTELELSYRQNSADTVTVPGFGTATLDGDLKVYGVMANAYLDFRIPLPLQPYVGAGIGAAFLTDGDEDDTVGAYQAMIGLGLELARNTRLIVEYRYFAAPNVLASGAGIQITSDYYSHNGLIGIHVGF